MNAVLWKSSFYIQFVRVVISAQMSVDEDIGVFDATNSGL